MYYRTVHVLAREVCITVFAILDKRSECTCYMCV